ncbi:MAG: ExeA family protein [Mangrovibacterium sp.]
MEYWHLKEEPFENVLDGRFLYISSDHEEALARLTYAVKGEKGGAVLTGVNGSGKSAIRAELARQMNESGDYRLISIMHPTMTDIELFEECLFQLESIEVPPKKTLLLHRLGSKLLEIKKEGKHTVIMIDDAHLMDVETLEELRLLSNERDDSGCQLFTLILIGETELGSKLENVPALSCRLPMRWELKLLSREETEEYIMHRLGVAGSEENLFMPKAMEEIYNNFPGNALEINNVCDLALLLAFKKKLARVDAETIREVISDLNGKSVREPEINLTNHNVFNN